MLHELENSSTKNPQKYWKLLSDLKAETGNDDKSESPIPIEELYKHFKNLYMSDQTDDTNLNSQLKEEESESFFSELDYQISAAEVTVAINKLKTKKASGLDGITAEMLKYCGKPLIPCLTKLFNMIFRSKTYPSE